MVGCLFPSSFTFVQCTQQQPLSVLSCELMLMLAKQSLQPLYENTWFNKNKDERICCEEEVDTFRGHPHRGGERTCDWSLKKVRGSNGESTEEGRQKEILTKPRYTHKSPDATHLLPVFYRAALRWRNSVTGQFLQQKIWSLSTLLPLAPLSLLFSVYPTWYHSVTSTTSSFFPIIPPPILVLLLVLYIPPVMFHPAVSIHLGVALLIPSHLLSSVLIPPVFLPVLPKPFPCAVPFPPTPLHFPSFFLIHSLSVMGFIHPLPTTCAKYMTIPLYLRLSHLHLTPFQRNSSNLCGFLPCFYSAFHSFSLSSLLQMMLSTT